MSTDPTQERSRRDEQDRFNSGSGYKFPSDIGSDRNSKAMKFNFFDYIKPDHDALEQSEPRGTITMMLPPQLSVQDQLSYNDFDGGIEYGGYLAGRRSLDGIISAFRGESEISVRDAGRNLLEGAATAAGTSLRSIGGVFADIASVETGKSLNPRVLSKFERVNFRTYQFAWLMIAKDEAEADAIREIVRLFKYHSHPSKSETGAFFNYPSLVTFEYLPSELNEWLWKPNPCAITSVSVDFNQSGTPKFFKGNNAPVECVLTVQLKEMIVDTKESLQEKFDNV